MTTLSKYWIGTDPPEVDYSVEEEALRFEDSDNDAADPEQADWDDIHNDAYGEPYAEPDN